MYPYVFFYFYFYGLVFMKWSAMWRSCHLDRAGHWMLKLVLTIEGFLLFCFFNFAVKCILGHLQDRKAWITSKKILQTLLSFFFLIQQQTKFQRQSPISKSTTRPLIAFLWYLNIENRFNFNWCFRLPIKVRS